jgi:cell wall-associated NlpC family hydrolase
MHMITGTALSLSMAGGLVLAAAPDSQAAPSLRVQAESIAEKQIGDPYRWGATGPNAFDCSGLVKYAFSKVGKTIPRTAQQQYNASRHESWRSRTKGDIVAFGTSARRITHIGIYVGYWKGKSWMINANTGAYRGRKVVIAPILEYLGGGRHAYYGRIG